MKRKKLFALLSSIIIVIVIVVFITLKIRGLKVAVLIPLTGKMASEGLLERDIIEQFYYDHPGTNLKVKIFDTETNMSRAAEMALQALKEGYKILIGEVFSSNTLAILNAIKTSNAKLMVYFSVSTEIEKYKNALVFVPNIDDKIKLTLKFVDYLIPKNANLLLLYTKKALRKELAYKVGDFLKSNYVVHYYDVDNILIGEEKMNYEILNDIDSVIVFLNYDKDIYTILYNLKKSNFKGEIILIDDLDRIYSDNKLRKNIDDVYGYVYSYEYTQKGKDFVERFKRNFGREPHFRSILFYDILSLLDYGYKKFGKKIIERLDEITYNGILGKVGVKVNKLEYFKLAHLKDGKIEVIEFGY